MNASVTSSRDLYDVLGLAPDASGDEVKTAYDFLIRQKAYRFDLPLHRWPQRVQEIKAAYLTISDPAKRSAYDQARGALEPRLWPTARTDAATDSLVRNPTPPQQKASGDNVAIIAKSGEAEADVISRAKAAKRPRLAKTGSKQTSDLDPFSDAAEASSEVPRKSQTRPKKAAKKEPAPKASRATATIVGSTALHEPSVAQATDTHAASVGRAPIGGARASVAPPEGFKPTPEEPHASQNMSEPKSVGTNTLERERAAWEARYAEEEREKSLSVKHLGAGVAITGALCLILFASWPRKDVRSLVIDTAQNPTFTAPQGNSNAPAAESAGVTPADDPQTGEILSADEMAAAQADAGAASASLRDWAGAGSNPVGEVAAQELDSRLAMDAQAPSVESSATQATVSELVVKAEPLASLAPPAITPSAEARASESPAFATAPVIATPTRADVGIVAPARLAATAVASPLGWISGGPTDADNRHGRYRGTVIVQFTVGPEGRVTGCRTARSSGNAKLDAATCGIVLGRARFKAARDAQGRPVASEAFGTYTWGRGRRPKS